MVALIEQQGGGEVRSFAVAHAMVPLPKDSGLSRGQLLSDDKYREALELYGQKFKAGIGAEAVKVLLENEVSRHNLDHVL